MSTNALALTEGFSDSQIEIIRSQVAPKGTTNDELAMFLMYCQRTGLDPFARQIYLSERRSKNQQTGQWDVSRKPETTIDGFRLIAERSRQYAGQLGPFWCGDDGKWVDVWIPRDPPVAAKVGILRHDFKEPLWAVALYDEYVQTKADGKPNSMWSKMPANQLAKCAESLGHRKAFPRELSGLYTREEMNSEQSEDRGSKEQSLPPATSPEVLRELSDTLDMPPVAAVPAAQNRGTAEKQSGGSPISTIEMRSAAKVAEADAVLSEVKKPKGKRSKGGVSFDTLKYFAEVKKLILEVTGTTEAYYAVLKSYGHEHADAIANDEEARIVYKALLVVHNTARADKTLRTELELCESQHGQGFWAVLGANGATNIDDVLGMDSEHLEIVRKELKSL
jgi:phage recombination protein Bet